MPAFCSQCGTTLQPDTKFCEECGVRIGGGGPSGIANPHRSLLWPVLLFTAVFGIGAFFLLVGKTQQRPATRNVEDERGRTVTPRKSTSAQGNVLDKLITGVRDNNFQKVFDTIEYYQTNVQRIKAANPQVLWNQLITQFYQREEQEFAHRFSHGRSVWESFMESALFPNGSGKGVIDVLRLFTTPSVQWQILEEKRGRTSLGAVVTSVYIKMTYEVPKTSPLDERGLIKETILEFVFGESDLVSSANHRKEGNRYWPNSFDTAQVIFDRGEIDLATNMLVQLRNTTGLPLPARNLLGRCYLEKAKPFYLKRAQGYFVRDQDKRQAKSFLKLAITHNSALARDWINFAVNTAKNLTSNAKEKEHNYTVAVEVLEDSLKVIGPREELKALALRYMWEGFHNTKSYNSASGLVNILTLDPTNVEARKALAKRLFRSALNLPPVLPHSNYSLFIEYQQRFADAFALDPTLENHPDVLRLKQGKGHARELFEHPRLQKMMERRRRPIVGQKIHLGTSNTLGIHFYAFPANKVYIVQPGSPADRGGLRKDDSVIDVDNIPMEIHQVKSVIESAVEFVKSGVREKIMLQIKRENLRDTLSFEVVQ